MSLWKGKLLLQCCSVALLLRLFPALVKSLALKK